MITELRQAVNRLSPGQCATLRDQIRAELLRRGLMGLIEPINRQQPQHLVCPSCGRHKM